MRAPRTCTGGVRCIKQYLRDICKLPAFFSSVMRIVPFGTTPINGRAYPDIAAIGDAVAIVYHGSAASVSSTVVPQVFYLR